MRCPGPSLWICQRLSRCCLRRGWPGLFHRQTVSENLQWSYLGYSRSSWEQVLPCQTSQFYFHFSPFFLTSRKFFAWFSQAPPNWWPVKPFSFFRYSVACICQFPVQTPYPASRWPRQGLRTASLWSWWDPSQHCPIASWKLQLVQPFSFCSWNPTLVPPLANPNFMKVTLWINPKNMKSW